MIPVSYKDGGCQVISVICKGSGRHVYPLSLFLFCCCLNVNAMKRFVPGPGFVIFLIFFGVSLLEAFQTKNWLRVFFWLAIGFLFLVLDNRRRKPN